MVMAINSDCQQPLSAWITLDDELHNANYKFVCLYSTDDTQPGATATVAEKNGNAIKIHVPVAGFVIYGKSKVIN